MEGKTKNNKKKLPEVTSFGWFVLPKQPKKTGNPEKFDQTEKTMQAKSQA